MKAIEYYISQLNYQISWLNSEHRFLKRENWKAFTDLAKGSNKDGFSFIYMDYERWEIPYGDLSELLKEYLKEVERLEEEKIVLIKKARYDEAAILKTFQAEFSLELDKVHTEFVFKNKDIFNKVNDTTIGFILSNNCIINYYIIKKLK